MAQGTSSLRRRTSTYCDPAIVKTALASELTYIWLESTAVTK